MRAADVAPGDVLVVCQKGLEEALRAGPLPGTVDVRHFNDVGGENAWERVALVVVIGRTQPSPSDKTKHVTPITFTVQLPLRYVSTQTAPLLADIQAEIEASGEDGTEFLEQISLGLRR